MQPRGGRDLKSRTIPLAIQPEIPRYPYLISAASKRERERERERCPGEEEREGGFRGSWFRGLQLRFKGFGLKLEALNPALLKSLLM